MGYEKTSQPVKPSVVVTGATYGGIGWGISKVLVEHGYHVFGSVRSAASGERVVKDLGQNFTPLYFDVTDELSVKDAAAKVRAALGGRTLAGLVNNAGIIKAGPVMHQPLADQRAIFEVNYFGVITVTQAFLPLLGGDRSLDGQPGKIINVSSVAGKRQMPFVSAYAASKHALEGMSGSLRRELIPYGIDVIVLGPGPVLTPIWGKEYDVELYAATDYGPTLNAFVDFFMEYGKKGHTAEQLGGAALRIMEQKKPPTRVAFVYDWFSGWMLPGALPDRMLDKMVTKMVGLTPEKFWARAVEKAVPATA